MLHIAKDFGHAKRALQGEKIENVICHKSIGKMFVHLKMMFVLLEIESIWQKRNI